MDNAANAKSQVQLTAQQEARIFEVIREREEPGSIFRDEFEHNCSEDNDEQEEFLEPLFALESPFRDNLSVAINSECFAQEIQSALSAVLTSQSSPITDTQRATTKAFFTLNRMPCSAHTLQLSIRAALDNECVKNAISGVRETCKFYRKSSAGADLLESVQKANGQNPQLRLLLDVITRWASTLCMISRFLKVREFVDKATAELYRTGFVFRKLRPGLPLTEANLEILHACVTVLGIAEDGTAILGRTKSPTMHLRDVVFSGIIANCKALETKSQPGTACFELARTLRENILRRREREQIDCEMSYIFAQAAALLSPAYKHMQHMRHLPAYSISDFEAIQTVAVLVAELIPLQVQECLRSEPVHDKVHKKRKVHSLLLPEQYSRRERVCDTAVLSLRDALQREWNSYSLIPSISADIAASDPLQFWESESASNRHRLLSLIARFVFCPPVASTESERVFSTAGFIRQKNRSRLHPSSLETILKVGHFLRCDHRSDGTDEPE